MRTMDITKVSVGKLDDLIALPTPKASGGSLSTTRAQKQPSSTGSLQPNSGSTPSVVTSTGSDVPSTSNDPLPVQSLVGNEGETLDPSCIGQPAGMIGKGKD